MKHYKKIQTYTLAGLTAGLLFINSYVIASSKLQEAESAIAEGDYKTAVIYLKNQLKTSPDDARARLLLGQAYLNTGNFAAAKKEIDRAYKLDKNSTEIQLAYAKLLLLKKDFKKTNTILANAYSNKQDESKRLVLLAESNLMQNKIADAKQLLDQSNSIYPNNQALLGLAQIALIEKNYQQTDSYIAKVLEASPDDVNALKLKANLANSQKDYQQALAIYNKLLKKTDASLVIHFERALTKLALNDLKGAEQDLAYILNRVKDNPVANLLMAQIKLQQKDYKTARELSQNVLNVDTQNTRAMLVQAVSNMALQAYNQAEKYFTQYLSIKPGDIKVQNLLANLYLLQNKPRQAIVILEGIDSADLNKNAKLLTTLGTAYLFMGDYEKGNAFLTRAKALNPDSSVIEKRLAASYIKTGDYSKAAVGLEDLLSNTKGNNKISNYALLASYIKLNKFKQARKIIDTQLKKDPDDKNIYNLKAVMEVLEGNDEQAKKDYQKALIRDPEFIPAYMGLASLAIKKNNIKEVKIYYNKILSIDNLYPTPYIALAVIAKQDGDASKAEGILQEGYKNVSGHYRAEIKLASALSKLYLEQKQLKKILDIGKQIASAYPDKNYAQYFLAEAQMLNGINKEAENTFNNIILKTPGDLRYRLILANFLSKQPDRKERVVELYNELQSIQPDNPLWFSKEINYLLQQKDYQQAHRVAEQLKNDFPKLSVGWETQGLILLAEKDFDAALQSYQQGYQIQASQGLLIKLIAIMESLNKKQQAIEFLNKELVKQPDNMTILFKLAGLHEQNKEYPQAIKFYRTMLSKQPDNILALNNLALIYLQQNDPQALELAEKAYKQQKNSPSIADTYGYILVKQGQTKKGLSLLKQVAERAPDNYNIQYHLAEAYLLDGDKTRAQEILKTITAGQPVFNELENARELLKKVN